MAEGENCAYGPTLQFWNEIWKKGEKHIHLYLGNPKKLHHLSKLLFNPKERVILQEKNLSDFWQRTKKLILLMAKSKIWQRIQIQLISK